MTRLLVGGFASLLVVHGLGAQTAPASYLTAAEVLAQLQRAATTSPEMMVARMVNSESHRVNVVKRTVPQGAIAHDVGTEVHYIIAGTATLVTGGALVRPAAGATTGSRATIRGGDTRTVHQGDLVLVPVNTPHWYSRIDEPLTYLEVRFDVK